jgi:hypothetical protein
VSNATPLLTNITTAADPYEGAPVPVPFRETRYNPRNILSAYVWATAFGGRTVTLQISPDYDAANPSAANWFTVRRVDETQATWILSDLETVLLRGFFMRLRVTGVGTITALNGVIY